MRKNFSILLIGLLLVGFVFIQSCKTAEAWSPVGTWTFNWSLPDWGHFWTDTLTFSGNESGGSVAGLTPDYMLGPQTGTWTKTGDYGITMSFDFMIDVDHELVNLSGNSTEASPNTMTGSGTWNESGGTASMTWNATKTM